MTNAKPERRQVLGIEVDNTSYADVTGRALAWTRAGDSRYVCVANVYSIMEAHDAGAFRAVMESADLVTPDGMPLVWSLKLLGLKSATRVYGPDLTPIILGAAAREGVSVGFYGANPEVLARLVGVVRQRFPALEIPYAYAPPFRPLNLAEDDEVVRQINAAGVRILFVGLGAPKQEYWMAAHRGRVNAVMLGVGAAFDFLAGTKRQAPRWMMSVGLEWLFRLMTEPRRLWRRYLKHNPRFIFLFALQLFGKYRFLRPPP